MEPEFTVRAFVGQPGKMRLCELELAADRSGDNVPAHPGPFMYTELCSRASGHVYIYVTRDPSDGPSYKKYIQSVTQLKRLARGSDTIFIFQPYGTDIVSVGVHPLIIDLLSPDTRRNIVSERNKRLLTMEKLKIIAYAANDGGEDSVDYY